MDRNWMKVDRLGAVYEKGVLEFLKYAEHNLPNNNGLFYRHCVVCGNIKRNSKERNIRSPLL